MRSTPILAGAAIALAAAGFTMAASPSSPAPGAGATPTPAAATAPAKTPAPTATPAPATTPKPSAAAAAAGHTWSAVINPLDVTTGTAMVTQAAGGTGIVTIKLTGLRADTRWSLDMDGGTLKQALEVKGDEIASRAGLGLERVSSDTVRIHLTAAEMKRFLADQKATGVVILVSDGVNRSAAFFAPGQ